MTIELRKDKLIDEDKLNDMELKVFKVFLKHERNRHLEDIANINKTLRELE